MLGVSSTLSSTFLPSKVSHFYNNPSANRTLRIGFSVTAVILGGQALVAINPGTLPLVVGVIIIGLCSLIPCFIGYDYVHHYERYAWILIAIVMVMLYGLGSKPGYDVNAQKPLEATGAAYTTGVLSFGGIVFGSFTGVSPLSSDDIPWY